MLPQSEMPGMKAVFRELQTKAEQQFATLSYRPPFAGTAYMRQSSRKRQLLRPHPTWVVTLPGADVAGDLTHQVSPIY